MRTLFLSLLMGVGIFLPISASAQFEFQLGVDPQGRPEIKESSAPSKISMDPYAEALSTELLSSKTSSYWQTVGISTSNTAQELSQYLRHGYGRIEIVTLLLIAEAAKENLANLCKIREGGKRLREIAKRFELDYDAIRRKANEIYSKCLAQSNVKKLENSSHGSSIPQPSSSTSTNNQGR